MWRAFAPPKSLACIALAPWRGQVRGDQDFDSPDDLPAGGRARRRGADEARRFGPLPLSSSSRSLLGMPSPQPYDTNDAAREYHAACGGTAWQSTGQCCRCAVQPMHCAVSEARADLTAACTLPRRSACGSASPRLACIKHGMPRLACALGVCRHVFVPPRLAHALFARVQSAFNAPLAHSLRGPLPGQHAA